MAGTFSSQLKALREAAGLSQNALGRVVDINPGTINRLETGEREPSSRDQVLLLAQGIGLNAEQTDTLVASAGFAPTAYDGVGLANPVLIRIARLLGAERTAPEREAFLNFLELCLRTPLDPVLEATLELWNDATLSAEERRDFRLSVALTARRWRQIALPL